MCIVPREKYGHALESLQSLLDNTPVEFDLVYVDAGSPAVIRRSIDLLLQSRPHVMHRVDHHLGPFEAMTIAIEQAQTPYLVIADNDILFRPGWLEALLDCAERRAADVVAPLVLIGGSDSRAVHVAGGLSHVESGERGRRIVHVQFDEHRSLDDPDLRLDEARTELVESHCVFARVETWRALGELPPEIGHAANVEELSMRFAATQASVWFTPVSEVVYLFDPEAKMERYDIASMNRTWSEAWTARDRAWLQNTYDLAPMDTTSRREISWWMADHRRIWLSERRTRLLGLFEMIHLPIIGRVVWKAVERIEVACNRLYIVFHTRRSPNQHLRGIDR